MKKGKCSNYEPGCIKYGDLYTLRFSDGSFLVMCANCKFKRLDKYPQLRQYQGSRQHAPVAAPESNESGL